jgi:hypothetical protein
MEDKTKLELIQVIEENMVWIERNQHSTKEEYETKLKELLTLMKPLQDALKEGKMPSQDAVSKEPNIADVD